MVSLFAALALYWFMLDTALFNEFSLFSDKFAVVYYLAILVAFCMFTINRVVKF